MSKGQWARLLLAVSIATLGGCGGAGNAGNRVSIVLTPASVATPINSAVALHAGGNLPKHTNIIWTAVEQGDLACTTNEAEASSTITVTSP